MDHRERYRDKRVMLTGGLGFIGSNLAHRLVEYGADVLIVDSLIPEYGGNLFNIEPIKERVTVNIADVRDEHSMHYLVKGRDIVFPVQLEPLDPMLIRLNMQESETTVAALAQAPGAANE